MFLAKVYVTPKPTVNDPQGRTVMAGLKSMGFASVADVREGKYLEIRIDESERARAEAQLKDMCDRLLANPVIEEYRYELVEG
jgi:phosphoribosylformylglycinamidine synthase